MGGRREEKKGVSLLNWKGGKRKKTIPLLFVMSSEDTYKKRRKGEEKKPTHTTSDRRKKGFPYGFRQRAAPSYLRCEGRRGRRKSRVLLDGEGGWEKGNLPPLYRRGAAAKRLFS